MFSVPPLHVVLAVCPTRNNTSLYVLAADATPVQKCGWLQNKIIDLYLRCY